MPAPSNDNFTNATLINPETPYTGTLVGSTIEANEYNGWDTEFGAGNAATLRSSYPHTVWYKLASYVSPAIVSLDGDDPSAADYMILYVGDNGPGPDSQDNILPLYAVGFGSLGGWSFTSGRTYYVQLIGISPVDPSTFTFTVGVHAPPDLAADVRANAALHGQLDELPFRAAVTAKASVSGTLAINSLYVDIVGRTVVRDADLQIDDNLRVTTYWDDPSAPLGGSVTAGDLPLKVDATTYPGVTVLETVGAAPDTIPINQNLTLLATDAHSGANVTSYAGSGVPGVAGQYSCERWMRFRFTEPFNTVESLRIWCPTDLSGLNAGWELRWGVTDTYQAPVTTASSIATNAMPTSDPGTTSHVLLDGAAVDGNETRYSKWLVIQAYLTSTPAPGAMYGYTQESSQPVPIELQFAWLET